MKFGLFGTGTVGRTLGAKLVELGHDVTMGSRTADNPTAAEWAAANGERAHHGTFRDAAAFGELVVNATAGEGSVAALESAGTENLDGKVLIDTSNAIDHSSGFPPTLTVANTDSVAEQLQRSFPRARVVKALNTVNAQVMVNPGMIEGPHHLFIAGDDADAKAQVSRLLESFGWAADTIVDLGDISNARPLEMYLTLWIRLMRTLGTPRFNIRIVQAS